MSGHRPWLVAPDRKDLVFVPGVAQPMRCGSAERARLIAAAPGLLLSNERLLSNFRLLLASKPVRDAAETIAEAEHAIAAATGETK